METSYRTATGTSIPTPGLLILTGASHTGKTSVARSVLNRCEPPTAFLSVDEVLAHSLVRPPQDPWAEIPLAYELICSQAEILLSRGWLVVVESTFTYIPRTGPGQFHGDALERLLAAASFHAAAVLLVQLYSDAGTAESRAERTERLSPGVVTQTEILHREAELPVSALRLDTTDTTPERLAGKIIAALEGLSTPT